MLNLKILLAKNMGDNDDHYILYIVCVWLSHRFNILLTLLAYSDEMGLEHSSVNYAVLSGSHWLLDRICWIAI